MARSSRIARADVQIDGRRYITEVHEDPEDGEQRFVYLAEIGDDTDVMMRQRADFLDKVTNGR